MKANHVFFNQYVKSLHLLCDDQPISFFISALVLFLLSYLYLWWQIQTAFSVSSPVSHSCVVTYIVDGSVVAAQNEEGAGGVIAADRNHVLVLNRDHREETAEDSKSSLQLGATPSWMHAAASRLYSDNKS